jgi:Domain of unknown function (DUF1937)
MSFIYIASPYSDPDPKVREYRYLQVCYYTIGLLSKHEWAYSPIAANHDMAERFKLEQATIKWLPYNFALLSSAKEMHVLMLDGWKDSFGVTAEVAFWRGAREPAGLPLKFIEWDPTRT